MVTTRGLIDVTWGIIKFFFKIPGDILETAVTKWMDNQIRLLLDRDTVPAILKIIERGEVSKLQLADTIHIRYRVADEFLLLLTDLESRTKMLIPTTQCGLKNTLTINLREESGIIGYDAGAAEPHARGRARLLHAIGAYTTRILQSTSAKRLLDEYFSLIKQGDVFTATGAMFYYEWRIAAIDYPRLISGFEKIFADNPRFGRRPIDQKHPLWHLVSHAEHDKDHAWELWTALLHSVKTIGQARATLAGVRYAQKIWKEFWDNVERDVLRPF